MIGPLDKISRIGITYTYFLVFLSSCSNSNSLSTPSAPLLVQNVIHPKACGPCALVHSFSHASKKFRSTPFFQQSYKKQVENIINQAKELKSTSSSHSQWNPKYGMKTPDLLYVANRFSPKQLSSINLTGLKQGDKTNLEQTYQLINSSITKGFPPILSIKQQVHKPFKSHSNYYWIQTRGHFITLTKILPPSTKDINKILFEYIDSLDGKKHQGWILDKPMPLITTSPLNRKKRVFSTPFLTALMPELQISKTTIPDSFIITTEINSAIGLY